MYASITSQAVCRVRPGLTVHPFKSPEFGSGFCSANIEQGVLNFRERRSAACCFNICQSNEVTGPDLSHRCIQDDAGVSIMQTFPLHLLYHLSTDHIEYSLSEQANTISPYLRTPC